MTDIINTLTANPELTVTYAKVAVVAISTFIAAGTFFVIRKGI
jgi:hypothetical protein